MRITRFESPKSSLYPVSPLSNSKRFGKSQPMGDLIKIYPLKGIIMTFQNQADLQTNTSSEAISSFKPVLAKKTTGGFVGKNSLHQPLSPAMNIRKKKA